MIRGTIMASEQPSIFISYSHVDEEWKDLLVGHLGVLGDRVRTWDDRNIQPGDDWKAAIERELNAASVAVLLVSVDFLNSRFVQREEIPVLLKRREQRGLRIVPVILRACLWKHVPWLASMQVRPLDGEPLLSGLADRFKREVEFVRVAEEVVRLSAQPPVKLVTRANDPERERGAGPTARPEQTVASRSRDARRALAPGSDSPDKPSLPEPTPIRPAAPAAPAPVSSPPASARPTHAEGGGSQVERRRFEFETVTLDRKGRELVSTSGEAVGWAEPLAQGVTLEMVELPGGRYERGTADGEDGDDDERPQHAVRVMRFAIGRFAITQAQWRVVAGWRKAKIDLDADPAHFKGDERPVEQVSWHDASEFCARLSARTGRTYRLPSEAEWEYAARAGTTSPFAFGATITPAIVNYDGNHPYADAPKGRDREGTTPVGKLGVANAFGLFDMHGNVWEWCQDPWHASYHDAPSDGRVWEQAGNTARRVLRGGSWFNFAWYCRSANRYRNAPVVCHHLIGLRVACEVART